MIRRIAGLAVLGMLALAGTAQAVTLVNPDGTPVGGRWQQWIDQAKVPTVSGVLTLTFGNCPGYGTDAAGCATPAGIWLRRGISHPKDTLLHELGHMFDFQVLTDTARERFMQIWNVPSHSGLAVASDWWYNEDQLGQLPRHAEWPPGEWFAEGYRLCALRQRWNTNIAEELQNRDWTWPEDGDGSFTDYNYPAYFSAYSLLSGRGTPRAKRAWAIRSQRATCTLIRNLRT